MSQPPRGPQKTSTAWIWITVLLLILVALVAIVIAACRDDTEVSGAPGISNHATAELLG